MSKGKRRAALALLVASFPQAFSVNPKLRKPLKIGIDVDLITKLDGAIQRRELGFVLTAHCDSISYLRNCSIGVERIDLDGNPAGTVSEREAAYAVDKLAKKRAAATTPQLPPAKAAPPKLSLADLKRAAAMRKEAAPRQRLPETKGNG
jgi:ProP effector